MMGLDQLDDERYFTRKDEVPWPDWVQGFREHQVEAVEAIVDAYGRGVDVVFLDAPTGAGKTLIAEMVRRVLGERSVYVCSSKSLQDQFLEDFEYARVLKGRANYPTEYRRDLTAQDCTGAQCGWCEGKATCAYLVAKRRAGAGAIAVLNTAYYLAETQNPKSLFGQRGFVVCDESDTLEAQLMGAVEFRLSAKQAKELGVKIPVKGARVKTVREWLEGELVKAARSRRVKLQAQGSLFGTIDDPAVIRDIESMNRLIGKAARVAEGLSEGDEDGGESWGDWVRDYDFRHEDDLVLKPVRVGRQGARMIWPHGKKWLLMSASLISSEEQAESLGVMDAGLSWETVTVPMAFPAEQRPIVYRPAANMVYKDRETETPKMVEGVAKILEENPDENVLVHTVNYRLAGELYDGLRGGEAVGEREVWTYRGAGDRAATLERFKAHGGVLLAPSMDRGIDLPDDLCRVVVVAKIPFLNLSDRQVSERMRGPGGQGWYAVQVARTMVQMSGRGVRHEDDWCSTYILDRQFGKFWAEGKRLFPDWWKEALNF